MVFVLIENQGIWSLRADRNISACYGSACWSAHKVLRMLRTNYSIESRNPFLASTIQLIQLQRMTTTSKNRATIYSAFFAMPQTKYTDNSQFTLHLLYHIFESLNLSSNRRWMYEMKLQFLGLQIRIDRSKFKNYYKLEIDLYTRGKRSNWQCVP